MMETDNEHKLLEVFAGTALQAGLVKSLLENAEIEVFLKDEIMGTLNPWHAAPGGAGAVKVFVSSENSERAGTLISEMKFT